MSVDRVKNELGFMDNNELLTELITKQIKDLPHDKKLQYTDLKRICKYINTSIFDENRCCIWNGYITNSNNSNKGTYINFYFRKKKAALHRLLYLNFVGELSNDEYLKFTCEKKGQCCNISHLKKFEYQKKPQTVTEPKKTVKKSNSSNKVKIINRNTATDDDLDVLYVTFD